MTHDKRPALGPDETAGYRVMLACGVVFSLFMLAFALLYVGGHVLWACWRRAHGT